MKHAKEWRNSEKQWRLQPNLLRYLQFVPLVAEYWNLQLSSRQGPNIPSDVIAPSSGLYPVNTSTPNPDQISGFLGESRSEGVQLWKPILEAKRCHISETEAHLYTGTPSSMRSSKFGQNDPFRKSRLRLKCELFTKPSIRIFLI